MLGAGSRERMLKCLSGRAKTDRRCFTEDLFCYTPQLNSLPQKRHPTCPPVCFALSPVAPPLLLPESLISLLFVFCLLCAAHAFPRIGGEGGGW